MAGVRHHTIQKLLLRGFSSRTVGKTAFAWHYRRGAAPHEVSLRDLTVIKHFYGKAGALNADDVITEFEGTEITPLVQGLRQLRLTQEVHDDRISPFVAHWMVRTRALREKFVASSDFLIDAIRNQVATPEGLDRLLPGLGSLAGDLTPVFEQYFKDLKKQNPTAARHGHVKALSSNVSPPLRVDGLRSLKWTLNVLAEPVLIVGDVGPLAQVAGQGAFVFLTDKGEVVERVFVPISADRLLLGEAQSLAPWTGSVDELNLEFASHSVDEFIASECSDRERKYHAVLGSYRDLLPTAMLDDIAKDAAEQIFGAGD